MIRRAITKALRSTAYHEAGHAIAARSVRRAVKKLSIVSEGGATGFMQTAPYFTAADYPDYNVTPRKQRRLENMALVCLAGPEAQRRFNPKGYRQYHAAADRRAAFELLSFIHADNDALEAYAKLIRVLARNFVRNRINWSCIEDLAAALVERREMSGKEVHATIM